VVRKRLASRIRRYKKVWKCIFGEERYRKKESILEEERFCKSKFVAK
jgi:hypothetical protein